MAGPGVSLSRGSGDLVFHWTVGGPASICLGAVQIAESVLTVRKVGSALAETSDGIYLKEKGLR